jgi:hypothetical protein
VNLPPEEQEDVTKQVVLLTNHSSFFRKEYVQ